MAHLDELESYNELETSEVASFDTENFELVELNKKNALAVKKTIETPRNEKQN